MNQNEIQEKLKEQEEEEKARTTFSKEQLEQVVAHFGLAVLKSEGLNIDPSHFKFLIEEQMINSSFMKAGNPVEIHINMKDLADALVKKGKYLYEFKRLIESCLRTVPKLLPSLAVIPARQYAKWNEELKKFKWHTGDDTDFLPRLLPDSRIHYDITLRIVATDVVTDTKIIVSDRNFDLIKLKRLARETLSEEVNCPNEIPDSDKASEEQVSLFAENDIPNSGRSTETH